MNDSTGIESFKEIMDPDQLVAVSTDGASSYIGVHSGMFSLLQKSRKVNQNIIFLPDFCHKVERLMSQTKPGWIAEILSNHI